MIKGDFLKACNGPDIGGEQQNFKSPTKQKVWSAIFDAPNVFTQSLNKD